MGCHQGVCGMGPGGVEVMVMVGHGVQVVVEYM